MGKGFTNGSVRQAGTGQGIPSFINGHSKTRNWSDLPLLFTERGFKNKAMGIPSNKRQAVRKTLLLFGTAFAIVGLLGMAILHILSTLAIRPVDTPLFLLFSLFLFSGLGLIYHWGSKYEHVRYGQP